MRYLQHVTGNQYSKYTSKHPRNHLLLLQTVEIWETGKAYIETESKRNARKSHSAPPEEPCQAEGFPSFCSRKHEFQYIQGQEKLGTAFSPQWLCSSLLLQATMAADS